MVIVESDSSFAMCSTHRFGCTLNVVDELHMLMLSCPDAGPDITLMVCWVLKSGSYFVLMFALI